MIRGRFTKASLARVQTAIRRQPDRLYPHMRTEFQNWGIDWQQRMQARFTGTTGPGTLRNRSGRLQGSLQHHVSGSSIRDLSLRMVTEGVLYARVQEYGGAITPRNAKFLTIPIGSNITPGGDVRYKTVKSLVDAYGEERLVFFRGKSGGYLAGVRDQAPGVAFATGGTKKAREKKGSVTPYFVLKKKVVIPPRLGFFETWNKLAPRRSQGLVRVARIARGA